MRMHRIDFTIAGFELVLAVPASYTMIADETRDPFMPHLVMLGRWRPSDPGPYARSEGHFLF